MSLDIKSNFSNKSSAVMHYVPCKIAAASFSGNLKLDDYFVNSVEKSNKDLSASLRGRPINGVEVKAPEGYTGIVMSEPKKMFNDEEERNFKISGHFEKFTYWNLDKTPSDDDRIRHAFDWIELAKTIHGPTENTKDQQEDAS